MKLLRPLRNPEAWHRWFAWYPIRIGDNLIWLQHVERRREDFVPFEPDWEFREIGDFQPVSAPEEDADERLCNILMGCASVECLSYEVGRLEAIDAMTRAVARIEALKEELDQRC